MAYADGFSPTTLGILFSHTASRYIFLFSYLASTQGRGNNSEKTIYNIYRIFEGRYHTYTYYTVEREAGDYKQLLYHCYTSWESLVISTDLE